MSEKYEGPSAPVLEAAGPKSQEQRVKAARHANAARLSKKAAA